MMIINWPWSILNFDTYLCSFRAKRVEQAYVFITFGLYPIVRYILHCNMCWGPISSDGVSLLEAYYVWGYCISVYQKCNSSSYTRCNMYSTNTYSYANRYSLGILLSYWSLMYFIWCVLKKFQWRPLSLDSSFQTFRLIFDKKTSANQLFWWHFKWMHILTLKAQQS